VHQQFGLAAAGLTMAPRRKVSAQHSDAVVFLQGLLPRGDDVGVPEWVPIDSFDEGAAGHGDRSRVEQIGGDPYDGVQLSYEAGRRNLYLTPEGVLRLAFLLAAAVERDIDIR
jgi:hypothetical protein